MISGFLSADSGRADRKKRNFTATFRLLRPPTQRIQTMKAYSAFLNIRGVGVFTHHSQIIFGTTFSKTPYGKPNNR
jgi:hypothetical protein